MTLVEPPALGIFVGGQARRMGGQPKGLLTLQSTGQTIVSALSERFLRVCPTGKVLLVGRHPAYAGTGLPQLADEPGGIGPIGGLHALLRATRTCSFTLAVGCDMPFIDERVFQRLLAHPSTAPALSLKRQGQLEPLCSRFIAQEVLPTVAKHIDRGRHALRALLEALNSEAWLLPERDSGLAQDWDTESDRLRYPA